MNVFLKNITFIGIFLVASTSAGLRHHEPLMVLYESELRCPFGVLWCFQSFYYDEDVFRDDFLMSHPQICTTHLQSGISLVVSFPDLYDYDAEFEPYVEIIHNCSMHGDTTFRHTRILPKVNRYDVFNYHRYRIYINDDGEPYWYWSKGERIFWKWGLNTITYQGEEGLDHWNRFVKEIPWKPY